jgi:hypothetical protein
MATLVHFPARWDLPSFDPACLQLLTYVRMAGWDDLQTKATVTERISPSNSLPLLKVGPDYLCGDVLAIMGQLPTTAFIDADLTPAQRGTTVAFHHLLLDLDKARVFEWFMLDDNYQRVTRRLYGSTLAFPLSYVVPGRLRAKLTAGRCAEDADEVYANAELLYAALSQFLGQNTFFLGDKPHSLDALVFGQLAVHVASSQVLPDKLLLSRLLAFPNLIGFVQRMAKAVYKVDLVVPSVPAPPPRAPGAKPSENTPLQQLASKRSRATFWTSSNAQQVLFATGSVAALLFVLWQGIGSRATALPLSKPAS